MVIATDPSIKLSVLARKQQLCNTCKPQNFS